MTENILIIAAHSDDQIIGAGGTAAKYAKEGLNIKTIIVFGGEESHPHFQQEIIINSRIKESLKADKVIGGKGVNFLNFVEKGFSKEDAEKAITQIEKIVDKLKPTKIFTHTPEDPHPGHRKISNMVLEVTDKTKKSYEVYTFNIWSPFKIRRKNPRLIVDISDTYKTKIQALKCFKSQFNLYAFLNYIPLISMFIKNIIQGRRQKVKFAEVFYRIR
ncbi:MAG: PIG-L family deacetylase [Nanoarchaeota archaeon]|nr:PIG-L family deacetylase [Nanoarchaeota archaeon]MBU1854692.1 PIG-L family deacetylase [Nanoarchaeota archaeon]